MIPERFIGLPYRPLTEDELGLLSHCSRWGYARWPYRKLGSKWIWEFRTVRCGGMFKTKREAAADFERFHSFLLDCMAYESWKREIGNAACDSCAGRGEIDGRDGVPCFQCGGKGLVAL